MSGIVEYPVPRLVSMLVEDFPAIKAVYRFGSFGTEYERSDSDLDLGVYAGKPLPTVGLWYAAQEMSSSFGRDVDVVDLGSASTVIRSQVIHTGERVYCADELACETFENYVYSSYARLNEERRGILQDILNRQSVYG